MSKIDKLSFSNELKSFMLEHEDYSIGQSLYALSRPQGDKSMTGKVTDLLKVSDEDMLKRMENAKRIENEL